MPLPVVLIVDDSPVDLRIAGECVTQCGAEPRSATGGQEALDLIERELPDVVLTDLVMPGMSGLELVKILHERHPRLPIIVVTGKGSEQAAIEALRSGATSYISKTNLMRDLADALKNVLDAVGSRLRRDQVRDFLRSCEVEFELDYQPGSIQGIIGFVQALLESLNYFDESELMQVSMALAEAITNAIEHGNLELDSSWRDDEGGLYRKMAEQRVNQQPYCDRRAFLRLSVQSDRVVMTVRDEGPGFDPECLADPTDPEFLLKPSGRGIMLMKTFMDEVEFNEKGNEITLTKYRRSSDAQQSQQT